MVQEFEEAKKHFEEAIKMGFYKGAVHIAEMYFNGFGVEKDEKKAFQILEKMAEDENNDGMRQLAEQYLKGFGVEKNEEKAIQLYLKAGENGDYHSYSKLARHYQFKKDFNKAVEYYEKAFLMGDANSAANAGMLYFMVNPSPIFD